MYKLLLSWRYLKTRFIALASIISVTLGVATLIVVNSVMAGFVDQMKNRLHGILSDVEISTQMFSEISYPERHVEIIKDTLGDELEEATCVVRTPALLSFDVRGRQWTQQIMLLGIDDTTFGKVTDFEPYLTNTNKQTKFSFDLEESGYDQKKFNGDAGWAYRRSRIEIQRRIEQNSREYKKLYDSAAASYQEPAPALVQAAPAGRKAPQKRVDLNLLRCRINYRISTKYWPQMQLPTSFRNLLGIQPISQTVNQTRSSSPNSHKPMKTQSIASRHLTRMPNSDRKSTKRICLIR